MIYNIDTAKQVAKYLLQINAIILQPNNPFIWAAGWKSPIYCDNRKILSYPEIRTYIRQNLSSIIQNRYKGANIIGGVATAGIPHGCLVAEELGMPFIYIRAQTKKHGRKNKIEGNTQEGESVILVEDLISSGKSSLAAVSAVREAGMYVKGVISIFNYGFNEAQENFQKEDCEYISLCDYENILSTALESNYITVEELETLKKWRELPSSWGK